MKGTNYISEKYRKYLLEIIFAEQKYYTVFGADLSDKETDKLLVDVDGNILLFSMPADLLSLILKSSSFFDNSVLQEWAGEINGIKEPYTVISFDVLTKNIFDLSDVELFKSIYDTLGIVKDYSVQIGDERLRTLLDDDILLQFKGDLAGYFTWSESTSFKISVNVDVLFFSLKEVYKRLKEKLSFYQ
ncbi:hypothetical protein [Chitinophaga arvensicola]|uniref:Uncharacterized protein n=1 Tax=Chitinophaga arvensicola TaxID=29529 RepID=A0A1I0S7G9_9BACT|nr:hypothetical protein [Chitinophaga arvensicola]SEW51583.1 hypothetical protein SAMN04488122_4341 [Chitinophaga arvensicola]